MRAFFVDAASELGGPTYSRRAGRRQLTRRADEQLCACRAIGLDVQNRWRRFCNDSVHRGHLPVVTVISYPPQTHDRSSALRCRVLRRWAAAVVAVLSWALIVEPAGAVSGGRLTAPARHPSFVSFYGCGGTLVAPDRVLTAAHCVAGRPLAKLGNFRLGSGEIRHAAGVTMPSKVIAEYLRSVERPDTYARHDLALVTLDAPVRARPARLVRRVDAGARLLVLGAATATPDPWREPVPPTREQQAELLRQTAEKWSVVHDLRAAPQRLVQGRACRDFYDRHAGYRNAVDTAEMICAGDPDAREPVQGACGGDSGGPLLATRSRRDVLYGVVSWGLACGRSGDPTVFQRVDSATNRRFITRRGGVAPRSSPSVSVIEGPVHVGATVSCGAGTFDRRPDRIVSHWIATRTRRADRELAAGRSGRLVIPASLQGRQLSCVTTAANRWGVETTSSAPVHVLPAVGR